MPAHNLKKKMRCNECGLIVKARNYHLGTYHDYDYHYLLLHEERGPLKHRKWLMTKFTLVDQSEKLYYKNNNGEREKAQAGF